MKLFSKIILIVLLSTYGFANDSYIRGLLSFYSIKNIDDSGLLFSTVIGEKLPSISPNLAMELDLSYSADFSFDILEAGLYSAYTLHIPHSSFALTPRVGINYEKLNIAELAFEERDDKIEGFFLSYGLGIFYQMDKERSYYVDLTEKGNNQVLGYGIQFAF